MKPEQQIQKSILDYLRIRKIWHRRMNSGVMASSYKGKKSFTRFGTPGMADILAMYQPVNCDYPSSHQRVLWIEVKAPKGKQSEAQLEFQSEVEGQGHAYILAKSIDDVAGWLELNGGM